MIIGASSSPEGSYLFLDKKVAKNQGLDLMSDKFIKASKAAAQAAMKNRENALPCKVLALKFLQKL